ERGSAAGGTDPLVQPAGERGPPGGDAEQDEGLVGVGALEDLVGDAGQRPVDLRGAEDGDGRWVGALGHGRAVGHGGLLPRLTGRVVKGWAGRGPCYRPRAAVPCTRRGVPPVPAGEQQDGEEQLRDVTAVVHEPGGRLGLDRAPGLCRAWLTAASAPSRHGAPCPGSTVPPPVPAMTSSVRRLRAESAVAAPATIRGPVRAVYGSSVTRASPLMTVSRSARWRTTCP